MLIVTTQTIRHLYVRVYYDIPSVLDKYDDDEIDEKIKYSSSLDTLLFHFDKAYNEVIQFEKNKTEEELEEVNKYLDEPYNSKSKYKNAIQDWEQKEEQIHEVIVFWIVGLILVLLGSLLYHKKGKWLGLSIIIVGFIEMIWWSSPSISTSGSQLEFLKFLNTKLILSLITITILIVLWQIDKRRADKKTINK